MRSAGMLLSSALFIASACVAQSNNADNGSFVAGAFGSGGASGTLGVYIGAYDTTDFGKPTFLRGLVTGGGVLELGVIGPVRNNSIDGLFSLNYQPTYNLRRAGRGGPKFLFLNGGYSRFFVNGNGLNYGSGIIWRYRAKDEGDMREMRFEYREFYLPGWGRQPGFRISWEGASGYL